MRKAFCRKENLLLSLSPQILPLSLERYPCMRGQRPLPLHRERNKRSMRERENSLKSLLASREQKRAQLSSKAAEAVMSFPLLSLSLCSVSAFLQARFIPPFPSPFASFVERGRRSEGSGLSFFCLYRASVRSSLAIAVDACISLYLCTAFRNGFFIRSGETRWGLSTW